VDSPYTCAGGREPIFTVRVTNFVDGTSAIGIASPHVLADGKGYFAIITALATAYATGSLDQVPPLDFDCASVWEGAMQKEEVVHAKGMWSLPLFVGEQILKAVNPMEVAAYDRMMPRAKIHISHDECVRAATLDA
jgi:hypothetical protein